MSNVTNSPNMSLPVPIVSQAPGPEWASDINSCLALIDQHNHSSGSGVTVTAAGIYLTPSGTPQDSLNYNNSNAYAVRSIRFQSQSSALALGTDLGCLYESGVDLYYNDGSGNQIRITSGGSVAGSSGTITGLPSGTASASYSGGTFKFQSATNTPANVDGGSFIFRNNTANSKGLTLAPPNAMGSDYSITLPSLPASQSFMTIDNSGTEAAPVVYPLATAGIATAAVTKVKQAAVGQATAASVGFNNINSANHTINTLSFTNVAGRPVIIMVGVGTNGATPAYVQYNSTPGGLGAIRVTTPNGADIPICGLPYAGASGNQFPAAGTAIDTGATAGTGTYTVYVNTGGFQMQGDGFSIVAYEL